MWQSLTAEIDGPILEVGCGTGRVLLPLAQSGHTITGLDISERAIATAQTKVDAVGVAEQVTLQQDDMRHFDLSTKNFELAFIPLNTFMHCHTIDDQLQTLRCIHTHLQPNGILLIDLFYPDPTLLAEVDGRLYFEDEMIDDLTGNLVQLYWRHEIDLTQQMRHLVYLLDEIDTGGQVRRVRIPFSLRYFYRYEVELLLRSAGFAIETIYGDYNQTPYEGHSPRMIFQARRQ